MFVKEYQFHLCIYVKKIYRISQTTHELCLEYLLHWPNCKMGFSTTVAGYSLGACLRRASQANERDANNIDRSETAKRSYGTFFTQLKETGSSH